MKISNITFSKNITDNNQKTPKKNKIEAISILAGSTIGAPVTFLVMDTFSKNKKDYLQSIKNEINIYNANVEKDVQTGLKLLEQKGKPANTSEMEVIKEYAKSKNKLCLDRKLDNIKKTRKAHVNKWLKISTGIGISLGTIVLAIKNIYQKQKKELSTNKNITSNTVSTNNQTNNVSINSCFFSEMIKKQIPFKGII